jgi:hypothetical protein
MAFASVDAIVASLTGGKSWKATFQKVTVNAAASAAGRWHELFSATGVPPTIGFAGTAGQFVPVADTFATGSVYHGGNVSPAAKVISSMMVMTPTTTMCPAVATLVDFLGYYPSLSVNTPTVLANSSPITRYTSGVGVEAIATVQVLHGAAAPNISMTYTSHDDSSKTTGQLVFPTTASPVSTLAGNTTANTGPFFPRAAGSNGMKNVTAYTVNAGTTGTGTMAICLVRPLCSIPVLALNVASERDCLFQLPSLPTVVDGAYLGWIIQAGGAMIAAANFFATVDTVWE